MIDKNKDEEVSVNHLYCISNFSTYTSHKTTREVWSIDMFHPAAPPPDYQGEINHLQGEVDGLTQRVTTLEQEEQKAQDQTNQAIGGIQMVSRS